MIDHIVITLMDVLSQDLNCVITDLIHPVKFCYESHQTNQFHIAQWF